MVMQIRYRLIINLHHFHWSFLHGEVLCEHPHTRAYFEHGEMGARIHSVSYPTGYGEVGEEMLTQVFLRSYFSYHVFG